MMKQETFSVSYILFLRRFRGNIRSDMLIYFQVGAECLRTAVVGACYNVSINLRAVNDEKFTSLMKIEVNSAIQMANQGCDGVLTVLKGRLNEVTE